MLIKNHLNKNEYCLSKSGHWVRNFTKPIQPVDINDITSFEDVRIILDNEFKNGLKKYQKLEDTVHEKIVIIGDGYNFEESVKIIEDLPSDVIVFGVNKAFANWTSQQKRLNYYIVNNPYQECLYFYPQIVRFWPRCVASIRTFAPFLEAFQGPVYTYIPTSGEAYSGPFKENTINQIDDYRNSVCAAVSLAYKFRVKKLALMSTLEMYTEERPGTFAAKNGLWTYPQQKIAHDLVDANLYWMQKAKISVAYINSGLDYEFATYISVADLKRFFNDGQKR